jgi:hypothetical protein
MAAPLQLVKLSAYPKGGAVATLFTIVTFLVVLAGAAAVAYTLFEMSPYARHSDQFRDPRTGKLRGRSPHL